MVDTLPKDNLLTRDRGHGMVEEIATRIAHQKASMIDAHLKRFLVENGLQAENWTAESVKEELRNGGFEILQTVDRNITGETHTFKLCKVYKETSLFVPMPDLTIKYD